MKLAYFIIRRLSRNGTRACKKIGGPAEKSADFQKGQGQGKNKFDISRYKHQINSFMKGANWDIGRLPRAANFPAKNCDFCRARWADGNHLQQMRNAILRVNTSIPICRHPKLWADRERIFSAGNFP